MAARPGSPLPRASHRTGLLAAPALLALALLLLFAAPGARAAGGSALGWGYDYYGQTGNGTPVTVLEDPCQCIKVPTAVAGVAGVTEVAPSRYHTLVLQSDGAVKAFGDGRYGQLGDGGNTASATPVTVNGLPANVVAVAAGAEHSLALLADGRVMAWGQNKSGQLGLGTSSGPEICQVGFVCSKTPVVVPGLSDAVAVAAGENFSLALLASGTVVAWGNDLYGQLGDGTGISSGCECIDHPVPVPGVAGAMAISGGSLMGSGPARRRQRPRPGAKTPTACSATGRRRRVRPRSPSAASAGSAP